MSLDIYLTPKNECKKCGEPFNCQELYWSNITHNLRSMADAAGIYEVLWRPEEAGIKRAEQLIGPLRTAIIDMKDKPHLYEKHNSNNGWGLYEHFVPWLEDLLKACEDMPDSQVEVSV